MDYPFEFCPVQGTRPQTTIFQSEVFSPPTVECVIIPIKMQISRYHLSQKLRRWPWKYTLSAFLDDLGE